MPEPVCKSQESGGYEVVFTLLALNCVFHTKYSGRSQVRGKPLHTATFLHNAP